MPFRRFIYREDLDPNFVMALAIPQLREGEDACLIPLSPEEFGFRSRFYHLIAPIQGASAETREKIRAIGYEVLHEWFRPLLKENLDIVLKDIALDAPFSVLRDIHRMVMDEWEVKAETVRQQSMRVIESLTDLTVRHNMTVNLDLFVRRVKELRELY